MAKMILALCLGLYIGLHWQVKRSVDNHSTYGENRRHLHRHWDKD